MATILAQAQKEPIIPFEATDPRDNYKEDVTLSIKRYEPGGGRGATGIGRKSGKKPYSVPCQ
jgi:hypothetical protein